ncbi:MAG: flagellar protein FlgN, partial [Cyanobacteria bacterium]|nr:flagellar protein FlgN [Cyanobacteriota bacterium]
EIMVRKKEAIVHGDIETLSRVDQELVRLYQQNSELEHQRLSLMIQMGYQHKTLNEFIGCLEGNHAQIFKESRIKLNRVLENVKDLNQQNQGLLQLSLKWIENSVETIARLLTPETVAYSSKGDKHGLFSKGENTTITQSTIEHSA